MSDDCKDKLRIEAYKQCFIAKHHYDILSWSIAGGSLVFVGLIISTILKISLDTYWTTVVVRFIPAILAVVVVRVWHSIYKRNRFWGEVANETARDIEREAGINGPGIAFMKGELDKKIILKNTDENNKPYKGNKPKPERCDSKSMHKSIEYLMWCLIVLTVIAVFIPGSSLKCMGNPAWNMIEIRHQEMKEVKTDHYERYGTISVSIGFDIAMACGVV